MARIIILLISLFAICGARAQFSGGSSASTGSASDTGYSLTSGTASVSGQTYTSTNSDENAVQVTGGTLTMTDCTILKSAGDTEDSDGSSFYGINSAVYAGGSNAVINMTGGTITTTAKGANAIMAYNGGTVYVSDVVINTTENLSRGIHATGGGVIVANNLTITTAGTNCSVIATDRGGGTVTVTEGSYVTTGRDCAVVYSTGTITATDISGSSSQGEIGVIEGSNSINLYNCNLTSGSSKRGLMVLQSGSGDSEGYNGVVNIDGGTMTLTDESAPFIEVPTNITATITLNDVTLDVPSDVLMLVNYNTSWSTYGGTGNLVLTTDSEATYSGAVKADKYSTATVTVGSGVTWNGAIDTDNEAAATSVSVSGTWVLTADSYVDALTIEAGGSVDTNGYSLNYGSLSNNGSLVNGIGVVTLTATEGTDMIFTLSGKRVNNATTLPAGVYVVNGKKVLVH